MAVCRILAVVTFLAVIVSTHAGTYGPGCPSTMVDIPMWMIWIDGSCSRELVRELRIDASNCEEKLNDAIECLNTYVEACSSSLDMFTSIIVNEAINHLSQNLEIFCAEDISVYSAPGTLIIEGCSVSDGTAECKEEFMAIFRVNRFDERLCSALDEFITCQANYARDVCNTVDIETIDMAEEALRGVNIYCTDDDNGDVDTGDSGTNTGGTGGGTGETNGGTGTNDGTGADNTHDDTDGVGDSGTGGNIGETSGNTNQVAGGVDGDGTDGDGGGGGFVDNTGGSHGSNSDSGPGSLGHDEYDKKSGSVGPTGVYMCIFVSYIVSVHMYF